MPSHFPVKLLPLGVGFGAQTGTLLDTELAAYGVEFPCGGAGICRGCRVRVAEGAIAITPEMREAFTEAELAAGWRLACCSRVEGPLVLEVAQWEMPVLADESPVAFEPAEGVAIAIDLGTTTLAAQALDLATGEVLAVQTALNPQTAFGADVMSRIEYALGGGAGALTGSIREALGEIVRRLPRRDEVTSAMVVGNTAMHHLFCGIDVSPLAAVPFQPSDMGEHRFTPAELAWGLPRDAVVRFLPCLGGFVGSDLLVGILATRMSEGSGLRALIDLGTNGEIVLGNAGRILCASTAAGPAFEAGRIRMGMRASAGAISHVHARDGKLACRTIGDAAPRGICGSGLVDAVAAGLELGAILPNGRLAAGLRELELSAPVSLMQRDIRELQLAKGAIAAGLRILLDRWRATADDIETVYLAGAFGNYVQIASARRIGLLEVKPERIVPAGNTSLRGVKMALLTPSRRDAWIAATRGITEHVPLAADPRFQEIFAECLAFGPDGP
jgi:uncharacterized 2Fe-2S/4Fe-4S cluster protein (DUF4445 family)